MKKIEDFGVFVPKVLLPANIDLEKWSVIACDQYTQDLDYWKNVEKIVGDNPSTLNLILPEVYLNSPDKTDRIKKIRKSMCDYLQNGVFAEEKNAFIYLERKTAFGRTRKGLMALIDLETYEWKPFSKANIRATEATIVERIPPRMEIRRGAPLELPHIMLLVNDKDDVLVGGNKPAAGKKPVYSGRLNSNGGEITGWALESPSEIEKITQALNKIAQENTCDDGSTFLFAVGDGNHSLATAKAVWEERKAELVKNNAADEQIATDNVRFALVEIVNIYDSGLTFEPIHRVIFNIDNEALIEFLQKKLGGTIKEVQNAKELEENVKKSWANFGFAYVDKTNCQKYILLETEIKELAVSRLQPEIDEFLKNAVSKSSDDKKSAKHEIDYIHGSEEVLKLGEKPSSIGILLPPIAKDSFFETINGRGPLPRKSFSMGEADEKRFYLECRKLFNI